jgi:hypothetical protein
MADGAVQTVEKVKPSFYGLATTGGIVPTTFEDTWRIAETLSKSSLVRSALRNKPEDVMLMLMQGLELGLKPIQAITQIYVVDGVPSLSSKLKIALVRQSPVCEYFTCTFTDDTKATFETKRKGQKPVTLTFTIEQANAYGLTTKDNWKKKAVMLRWRAGGQLCDLEYSDVIGGVQTYDEAREMRERIVTGSHIMQSVGSAPKAPVEVPEVPDEDEDQEGVFAQVARGEVPPPTPDTKPPSIEEQLHIQIDEAENREQLTALNKGIGEVKNVDLRAELKKHWTRKWNDFDSGKAGK